MKHVFDIMTKRVITVSPIDPIATAANFMLANGVSGLPVVDNQNHVLGIITEHDFLTHDDHVHIPSYLNFLMGVERTDNMPNEIKKITVGDLMTSAVITILPEASIVEAATILSRDKINPLPVVDGDGFLQGIISRSDIVKLFTNGQ